MAEQERRFKAFVKLGDFLRHYLSGQSEEKEWVGRFDQALERSSQENGWFTKEALRQSLAAWGANLQEASLRNWLEPYPEVHSSPRTVAVIMAGNIPLVGFHDFLSVLLSGHHILAKLASGDRHMLPLLSKYLVAQEPELEPFIAFTDNRITDYDAVIATGSDNSARYFEYYFGKKPHIIRKNRNSVALLQGDESEADLQALGEDIFTYFGLGCRSVSKLYVPEGYDFSALYEALEKFSDVLDHQKYANNYDYNKAVYLMSEFPFLDNGFLLLKEDTAFASPIGCLFYESYSDEQELHEKLNTNQEVLQCVVGPKEIPGAIAFGTSQTPALSDYADGVDTMKFLLDLYNKTENTSYEKT